MNDSRESVLSATLEKWTNMWSGWQKRHCVLTSDGRLSYFLDQDNVSSVGSRGHITLAAAYIARKHLLPCIYSQPLPFATSSAIFATADPDLSSFHVSTTSTTIYFRAPNHRERQRWILALTSAKIRAKQRELEPWLF